LKGVGLPSVIILCTGNSCRSILAEALWREESTGDWSCSSAGTDPTGSVHPLALRALEEHNIPIVDLCSEPLEKYAEQEFDLAVTVCDDAHQQCPAFPGARKTLHWPVPDPAMHVSEDDSGTAAVEVFRTARDVILHKIQRFLRTLEFSSRLKELIDQLPGNITDERHAAYLGIVDQCSDVLVESQPWKRVPAIIGEQMHPFGWHWNGIYHLQGSTPHRRLTLGSAWGPPVCATIEEMPGSRSGMCFDAVDQGSLLVARDVKSWPGYVSCDGESGLQTISGMARPLLDAQGNVVAVWDVDIVEKLHPCDGLFIDALLEGICGFEIPGRKR